MDFDYIQVSVESHRLAHYSELLKNTFGAARKFNDDSLRWRYAQNPEGLAVGFDAYDKGVLAGHYVTVPVRAMVEGEEQKGLLSLNTAVNSNYRGAGLFPSLAEKTYQFAAENDYEFVVGVANANSTPSFLKKLNFQLVAPLQCGFLLSDAWNQEPANFQLVKNQAWIKWRLSNPAQNYSIKHKSNRTVISTKTDVPFIDCCALMEKQSLNESYGMPRLKLFIGLDPSLSFKLPAFIKIPEKLKSSPLNLIYRSLNGKVKTLSGPISFNFLDFDPY